MRTVWRIKKTYRYKEIDTDKELKNVGHVDINMQWSDNPYEWNNRNAAESLLLGKYGMQFTKVNGHRVYFYKTINGQVPGITFTINRTRRKYRRK